MITAHLIAVIRLNARPGGYRLRRAAAAGAGGVAVRHPDPAGGVEKPQLRHGGTDIFQLEGKYRDKLGYLPQDFGYYPDFSVEDYLLSIASLKGIRPAVTKQRVKELLGQVRLTKARKKKMKTLSGGMKRRAGFAQAMLNDP